MGGICEIILSLPPVPVRAGGVSRKATTTDSLRAGMRNGVSGSSSSECACRAASQRVCRAALRSSRIWSEAWAYRPRMPGTSWPGRCSARISGMLSSAIQVLWLCRRPCGGGPPDGEPGNQRRGLGDDADALAVRRDEGRGGARGGGGPDRHRGCRARWWRWRSPRPCWAGGRRVRPRATPAAGSPRPAAGPLEPPGGAPAAVTRAQRGGVRDEWRPLVCRRATVRSVRKVTARPHSVTNSGAAGRAAAHR